MKPTAASASKTAERVDAKTSPKQKTASKHKPNGHAVKPGQKPSAAAQHSEHVPHAEQHIHAETEQPAEAVGAVDAADLPDATVAAHRAMDEPNPATMDVKDDVAGNATPIANSSDGAQDAALEATPAGITSEETIR